MTTEMDTEDVEVDAISDAPRVPTTSSLAPVDASASAASNEVYLCGCCFVWEVSRGPHAGERAEFSVRNAGASTTQLRIGRHAQCWLRLKKDLEVSGFHAELRVVHSDATAAWKMLLCDDKSTNGTKINGEAAEKRVEYELKHQDLLLFGRSAVRVTRGSTRCPLAVQGDQTAAKIEPTEEPEPPRAQDAKKNTESKTQAEATDGAVKYPADESACVVAAAREKHGDDDAFEEPVRVAVAPAPASRLLSVCMVCGQELSAWSVLEQQLHVNSCLDRASGVASRPPSVPVSVSGGGGGAAKGTKRKRLQTTLATQPQDEELAVALALSKSLVGKEQQVAMDMALVSSELAQVDAQLAKLQKKRVALIKKLERLEKTKRKVHTGDVRSPEEARALLDLGFALRVLFPEPRRVQASDTVRGSSRRASIVRLLELYRGEQAKTAAASGADYVAMWSRASQQAWEDENEMFTNQLTRELMARAEETAAEAMNAARDAEETDVDVAMPQKQPEPSETEVPDVVKRVFPQWEENLAFLKTQSVEDLRDALDELRQTRVERQLEKVIQIPDHAEDQSVDEHQASALSAQADSGADSCEDDEELACAFFEQEMMRLIDEREKEEAPETPKQDEQEETGQKDVEIVELMDSEDDDGEEIELDEQRSEDDEMECTASGSARELQEEKEAEESPDSSDEDEDAASGETSPLIEDVGEVVATEGVDGDDRWTAELDQRDLQKPGDQGQEDMEHDADEGDKAGDQVSDDDDDSAPPDSPQGSPTRSGISGDSLEMRLLDALKANAALYEAVLLLQPLDLQQFLVYVREEARIKCAKTELVRFCDRHGITFKQS